MKQMIGLPNWRTGRKKLLEGEKKGKKTKKVLRGAKGPAEHEM